MSGCVYNLIFLKNEIRVELTLQRAVQEENKWLFDQLFERKHEIEDRFGSGLRWQRLDHRKSSRISHSHPFDCINVENWPDMIAWLSRHIVKLDKAISDLLVDLNRHLKSGESYSEAKVSSG